MVEMGVIRKERSAGVPLLLGANTLTEAVATAIPYADREEKVSWTRPRFSYLPPVMGGPALML
jgi:hypothetical protein